MFAAIRLPAARRFAATILREMITGSVSFIAIFLLVTGYWEMLLLRVACERGCPPLTGRRSSPAMQNLTCFFRVELP